MAINLVAQKQFPSPLRKGERIPRNPVAPCAPEPTPSPSKEGSDARRTVPLLGGVRGGLAGERFMVRASVQPTNFSPNWNDEDSVLARPHPALLPRGEGTAVVRLRFCGCRPANPVARIS